MKIFSVLFISILLASASFSQTPKVTWGDEFKMSKGLAFLKIA
jgi:hypothetical protein